MIRWNFRGSWPSPCFSLKRPTHETSRITNAADLCRLCTLVVRGNLWLIKPPLKRPFMRTLSGREFCAADLCTITLYYTSLSHRQKRAGPYFTAFGAGRLEGKLLLIAIINFWRKKRLQLSPVLYIEKAFPPDGRMRGDTESQVCVGGRACDQILCGWRPCFRGTRVDVFHFLGQIWSSCPKIPDKFVRGVVNVQLLVPYTVPTNHSFSLYSIRFFLLSAEYYPLINPMH